MNSFKGFSSSTYIIAVLFVLVLISAGLYTLNFREGEPEPLAQTPPETNSESESASQTASEPETTPTQPQEGAKTTPEVPPASQVPSTSALITFNGDGFSPSYVAISAGGTLSVRNASGNSLAFQSDPHPTHDCNPELNLGNVYPGQTVSVTLTAVKACGVHNHFNPTQTATVTVS
ncbi:MAG TPA: hypothetical protein VIH52_01835 [Candidatus Nanoarchaeia archaeon]|nr:hypothetical protein [uncultured archaeon]